MMFVIEFIICTARIVTAVVRNLSERLERLRLGLEHCLCSSCPVPLLESLNVDPELVDAYSNGSQVFKADFCFLGHRPVVEIA